VYWKGGHTVKDVGKRKITIELNLLNTDFPVFWDENGNTVNSIKMVGTKENFNNLIIAMKRSI
jgi:hypothetical protein